MSAQACLTAWNEPIGRPNCWRTPRVGDGRVEHRRGQPEAVAGDGQGGPVGEVGGRGRRIAVERPDRRLVDARRRRPTRMPNRRVASRTGWSTHLKPTAGVDVDDDRCRRRVARPAAAAGPRGGVEHEVRRGRRAGRGRPSVPERNGGRAELVTVGSDTTARRTGPVATSRSSSSRPGSACTARQRADAEHGRSQVGARPPRPGPAPRSTTAVSANVAPAPPSALGHLEAGPSGADEQRPIGRPSPSPSRAARGRQREAPRGTRRGRLLTTRPRSAPGAARGRARR